MEEIRGSPARRLSQILDPDRQAHLGAGLELLGAVQSAPGLATARCLLQHQFRALVPGTGNDEGPSGPDSPRLMPRRGRQGPTPPPRPRNNNSANSPVLYRDSPYVNVSNLIFQKDKSFADTAKSAGYVELKDSSGSSTGNSKAKCSPFNFTSDPSGHVEYVDGRQYVGQLSSLDFGPTCYENKAHDIQNLQVLGRSPFEPGTSGVSRSSTFERSFSMTGRQQPESQSSRHFLLDKGTTSSVLQPGIVPQEVMKEPKGFGSSKSFDGYSNTVEELNWQERCLELQLELHRSRNQASRVRDMLREKVSDGSHLIYSFMQEAIGIAL